MATSFTISPQMTKIVDTLKNEWNVIKTSLGNTIKKDFKPACQFLYHALDVLIITAEENIQAPGADKKAAVLAAFAVMFNTVIIPIMPIYLKPFSGYIMNFILTSIVSVGIDFVVGLYNRRGGVVSKTNFDKYNS